MVGKIIGTIIGMLISFLYIVSVIAIPASVILFLILMVLKLCGIIAWAWVLVCIPLFVLTGCIIYTMCVKLFIASNGGN